MGGDLVRLWGVVVGEGLWGWRLAQGAGGGLFGNCNPFPPLGNVARAWTNLLTQNDKIL